ncbi:uncharacterized protein F4817DRAFT_318837 [Daldinia loculata]|uniref:uncharacterized protein n=1 Tax=Daldinia loculata TaxID=103429 RepID=UPI0020C1D990|nr:uncharacterized protein F4817DRAFT_318837 [Daldinia loculata]KAI1644363.1 hypothetical protein F4817DRAFT_318837 [Daldinia loculata]
MAVWTRVLFFGLLALYHGVAQCTTVVSNQELALESPFQPESAPITTVGTAVETNAILSELLYNLSTFATIHKRPSHQIRTTQDMDLTTVTQSGSSSLYPTRTDEDAIGSNPSSGILLTHSPIVTEITEATLQSYLDDGLLEVCHLDEADPECLELWSQEDGLSRRDDYSDGYGYGYGSSTTPVGNGGYGNPPKTINLPPGAYGNQQTPAINKPSVVTVPDPDPKTVTVSLEYHTSSAVHSSSTTPAQVIVVIVTGTGESVSQTPEYNTTQTVTTSDPTLDPTPEVTLLVTSTSIQHYTTHSTEDYVYTTVTQSSSLPHVSSSTNTIYTVTGHPPPRPVPDTNAAVSIIKPGRYHFLIAAALVAIGPSILTLLGWIPSRLASSIANARRSASEETEGNTSGDGSNGRQSTVQKASDSANRHGHLEPAQPGCCSHCR